MGNKFNKGKNKGGKPPVCISKPPPQPSYPTPTTEAPTQFQTDPFYRWIRAATLPPPPKPPYTAISKRNLIYNVYPNPTNPSWGSNLHQLRTRLHLFNGQRVIAIATAPELIDPVKITAILGPDAKYFTFPNDPLLRETASFSKLLHAVNNSNPNQATFYAHTQGTAPYHQHDPQRRLAKRYWRNRMYHELLDDWPRIAAHLRTYPTVGTFKVDYAKLPPAVAKSPTGIIWPPWHFAGSFYWFRNDCTFRNPEWSSIPNDPYASEMWPGRLFHTQQAASVYQPFTPTERPTPNLYDPNVHLDPIPDIPF